MSASSELDRYIENLDTLIRKLSPAERRRLAGDIGRQIRQANKRRIQANIAPDGSRFTPRRGVAARKFSGRLRVEQDFVYNGKLRRFRTLRQLPDTDAVAGWEYTTGHLFKALRSKIGKPDNSPRGKLMFRKLHQYKYLKLKTTDNEAAVGFMSGLAAYIAAAHQYGEDGRPARELLGFSAEDLSLIEELVIQHFQSAQK